MIEEWRAVPGYEGRYEVSDCGNVRSLPGVSTFFYRSMGKGLKKNINQAGYFLVALYKDKERKTFGIHQLVVMAFIGPIPPGHVVNHKDGNKKHNTPWNLERCTRSENARHSFDVLGQKVPSGEASKSSRLRATDIEKIFAMRSSGMTFPAIAAIFKVRDTHISNIIHGRRWREVGYAVHSVSA